MMFAHHASDVASHHTDDGGKKARSPGRARSKPLKPLRREGRMNPPVHMATNSCALFIAHGPAGAAGTRLSLRPLCSRDERFTHHSGASVLRECGSVLYPCRHCLGQTRSVCAREQSDEAIQSIRLCGSGLLRGACHRARIRATRWLAMTERDQKGTCHVGPRILVSALRPAPE